MLINRNSINISPNFNGLTKKMKKLTYIDGQRDIKQILDKRHNKSFIVGELPRYIINKLPKENRKEAIMEIYSVFDEIATELREFDETKVYTIDEIQKRRNKSTVEKLENVLRKYKIVPMYDDVDLEYLGKGGKGAGYKINGLRDFTGNNEDEFIIKVFHIIEGESWQQYKSHGCYAELNSAQYWMHTVGNDTNRGKFFWGSMKSGYMINKFIDEDVRLPKRVIDPYKYGLKVTDEDAKKLHNVCKGYSYDWGGVRVINRLKNGDNYARKIAEVIENAPEKYRTAEWYRLLSKRQCSNIDSKNAGLAMSIKHLNNKTKFIDECLELHSPKVNRALSYVLKYLNFKDAIKYFEKLVQTNDVETQIILFNEIPLLAMKHRDLEIKDDLQTTRSEIMPTRIAKYYDLSEKYAMTESIEHLASFTHLLPKDDFRTYYKRLAQIENLDLQDRLIYKLSNAPKGEEFFTRKQIAKNLKDETLQKRLLASCNLLEPEQIQAIKTILSKIKK